jgi:hypothetical protein
MKKTVAILSDNPDLLRICQDMDAVRKSFQEKLKFITKQLENASKEGRANEKPLMDALRSKLRDRGKLTDDSLLVDYSVEMDNVTVGGKDYSALNALLSTLNGL